MKDLNEDCEQEFNVGILGPRALGDNVVKRRKQNSNEESLTRIL
jgi:hypothetical protein